MLRQHRAGERHFSEGDLRSVVFEAHNLLLYEMKKEYYIEVFEEEAKAEAKKKRMQQLAAKDNKKPQGHKIAAKPTKNAPNTRPHWRYWTRK